VKEPDFVHMAEPFGNRQGDGDGHRRRQGPALCKERSEALPEDGFQHEHRSPEFALCSFAFGIDIESVEEHHHARRGKFLEDICFLPKSRSEGRGPIEGLSQHLHGNGSTAGIHRRIDLSERTSTEGRTDV
jgi:hypothetical protein